MSFILNIDCTAEKAIVNIAEDGKVLFEETNAEQNKHASFLQPAIQSLLKKTGIRIDDVGAIAVSHGPGSYTGIRVGMATAKGLCYALGKPLITVSQLEIVAKDMIDQSDNKDGRLYCPLIDARRMEVFTAVYDKDLSERISPCAMILDKNSFSKILLNNTVVFGGTGVEKWSHTCDHKNAVFCSTINKGLAMSTLSFESLRNNKLANLAYAEPLYIKGFHTTTGA